MPAKYRVHNFNAGPAALPLPVLETIERELYDWKNTGMSVMEISHRSELFMALGAECEQHFRDLLHIPNNYRVLFLQGGGRGQFAMIPMNLSSGFSSAAYLDLGVWGQLAIAEADLFTKANVVASAKDNNYTSIPPQASWADFSDAAYLYYVDNETVNGLEFSYVPDAKGVPLICDMSSNILSRVIDINQFGLIFACAQKNLGIAGITAVIIRDDLVARPVLPQTPSLFSYAMNAKESSLLNTPPTFPWYVLNEVLKWVKSQGGVPAMEKSSQIKSKKLYDLIDSTELYHNPINPADRSRMNVIFHLTKPELEKAFFAEAEKANITGIKGHRAVGGARVSLYNAISEASVDTLVEFMSDFAKKN
jgi:phosphoserine aminotransferase